MQKIVPHLWFDNQAEEAAAYYTSIFPDSRLSQISRYDPAGAQMAGKAAGDVMTVEFELAGQPFIALNGGPYFSFTPAISFFFNGETVAEVDAVWEKLADEGVVLMELGRYPFNERFGWVQDKYGVSWQLNLLPGKQRMVPCLMFVGDQYGKAEEAMKQYSSLFPGSEIRLLIRNGAEEGGDAGTVQLALFTLHGQEFIVMDSPLDHPFTFTEATSLFVNCRDQPEVDGLWERLSEGGKPGECGWVSDRFGVSWQVVPEELGVLRRDSDPLKVQRVMQAMLKMQKLDVEGLRRAYAGD